MKYRQLPRTELLLPEVGFGRLDRSNFLVGAYFRK